MDIAGKLAQAEVNLGRVFINKLTEIEALNADGQLLEFEGQWYNVRRNDALAILGDKALGLAVGTGWYHARDAQGRPLSKKEHTNELEQGLNSNKNLAMRGFSYGLDACVITNAGHFGQISDKMMATAVEALIGAVWIDSSHNIEAVREVMKNLGFFDHKLLKAIDINFAPLDA